MGGCRGVTAHTGLLNGIVGGACTPPRKSSPGLLPHERGGGAVVHGSGDRRINVP